MIKLETHCHCLGGSGCASIPPETLVEEYVKAGYGGIVLTNHYCKVCYDVYEGTTHKQKLDFYFSLFDKVKKIGDSLGLKVFLGAETRAVTPLGTYSEFMLYGFERQLFYDNPPLFHLTQKEMFEFCNKHDIFMYQTHPFREGVNVGDGRFMHGAECFNGHVNHINDNESAIKFCEKFNLIKISGTDCHDANQPKTGGIFISDDISNEEELKSFIRKNDFKLFCDNETYKKELRIK